MSSYDEELAELIAASAYPEIYTTALEQYEQSESKTAKALLQPLINNKEPLALYISALFSVTGESSEQFEIRHIRDLTEAAESGFVLAIFCLGVYYDTGNHVTLDIAKALNCWKQAAELGYAHAQWLYGIMLYEGTDGAIQDQDLGLTFLQASKEQGHEYAIEFFDTLLEEQ